MATIGQLNQQISNLRKENDELKTELDEYKALKGELSSLIEAHLSCRNRDKSVVSNASLMPSRCVTYVLNELRTMLNSASGQALSGSVASLTGSIIAKQNKIGQTIDDNELRIRACQNQIAQLKRAALANNDTSINE